MIEVKPKDLLWEEAIKKLVLEGATVSVKDIAGPMALPARPVDYAVTLDYDGDKVVQWAWARDDQEHYSGVQRVTRDMDSDEVKVWDDSAGLVTTFSPIYDDATRRALAEWARGEGRARELPEGAVRYEPKA